MSSLTSCENTGTFLKNKNHKLNIQKHDTNHAFIKLKRQLKHSEKLMVVTFLLDNKKAP
ncbi:hypothetical protein [Marinomonas sp. ef1]|uniref:hypothetical protein n=1 Tax=Marinomonas sp. ef1 TaxID=2005043 RepID=UPI0012FE0CE5|nr:hypothetical protein [Marinomonas sp. ef1]